MYTIFHQLPATVGNLTGQELAGLFFALRDQGLASAVFYDGNVRRAADFVEMMEYEQIFRKGLENISQ